MGHPAILRASFRALHERGCFLMPNPWDAGSARALEQLGFPALATTSAGFAFSRGLPDDPGALGADEVVEHARELAGAVSIPLSVDFQAGYALDLDGLQANVENVLCAGAAGLSIEDLQPVTGGDLFAADDALERVRAAVEARDECAPEAVLTARTECYLTGHPDPLGESIRRLTAYAEAGADVLFAPGAGDPPDIRAIVQAVAPKPVNVLVGSAGGLDVAGLAELGVRRISVGSALARVAWQPFLSAARKLAADGSFDGLSQATPFAELDGMFADGAG